MPTGSGPRVAIACYIVYPSGYDEMVEPDKFRWCLAIVDGREWGWSVRDSIGSSLAMNRRGRWIFERSGSGHNKARRWPLEEAVTIALRYIDTYTINGRTLAEASAFFTARHGSPNA